MPAAHTQAAFGWRSDFDYWYEPCRRRQTRFPRRNHELIRGDCAAFISTITGCKMRLQDFELLMGDETAFRHGSHSWRPHSGLKFHGRLETAGGEDERTVSNRDGQSRSTLTTLYVRMMKACWVRHVAVKVIRLHEVPPPRSARSVLFVRHPANVVASRLSRARYASQPLPYAFATALHDLPARVCSACWRSFLQPGTFNPTGGAAGIVTHLCANLDAQLRQLQGTGESSNERASAMRLVRC